MVKKAFLLILFSLPPTVYGAAGGVSLTAEVAFMLGDLPVTNSMITSWVISLLIILVIRALSGKTSLIPNRGQLFVESIVGSIRVILEPIVGKKFSSPPFGFLAVCLSLF